VIHLSGFDLQTFILAKQAGRRIIWLHHDYGPPYCARPGIQRHNGPCGPLHLGRPCPLRQRGNIRPKKRIENYLRQWVHLASLHLVDINIVALAGHLSTLRFPRAKVIPHGVDLVRGQAVRASRPILTFVGRHAPGKGVDVLLKAVARLPAQNIDLVVLGDGPERPKWERLSESLRISADFRGRVTNDERADILLRSDLVVVPTVYAEYVGVVALEAMSCGSYVLASDIGGLGEVVRSCGGGTFRTGDDRALASSIESLLKDRAALSRAGNRLRRHVEEHNNYSAIAGRYLDLYRHLGHLVS